LAICYRLGTGLWVRRRVKRYVLSPSIFHLFTDNIPGQQIVLVHGLSIPAIVWKDVAPALAKKGFRVMVYGEVSVL
jgi:hypothetical protein